MNEQPKQQKEHKPDHNEENQTRQGSLSRFLLIFSVLLGIAWLLYDKFAYLRGPEERFEFLHITIMLALVSWLSSTEKIKIKYVVAWVGIFLVLFTGYSYRFELIAVKDRLLSNLIPSSHIKRSDRSVSVRKSSDGHFYIILQVNGKPVKFMIDTGASSIVLTPEVAEYLGINLATLKFDRLYHTANGIGRGASVRLTSLAIDDLYLMNVKASINQKSMGHSLLGMSFLNRLQGYQVKRDELILNW